MNVRRKILFLIGSLGGGGAERALVTVCGSLDRVRFEAAVMVLEDGGVLESELAGDIPILRLEKRSRWDVIRLAGRIKKSIREFGPDLVVSHLTYSNILLLLARKLFSLNVPCIIVDHIHLSSAIRRTRFRHLRTILIRHLYGSATMVVNVSRAGTEDLIANFKVDIKKATAIYDPIDLHRIDTLSELKDESTPNLPSTVPVVVAVGRLTPQKDFPTLLRAFLIVANRTNAHLAIIGTGEQREDLEALACSLGIDGRVHFLGFKTNPYPYFGKAECFVLSSLYEGFGIVIVEAMRCGCPVVATDCPSGPGELISHGRSGLLVPIGNPEVLAENIISILTDRKLADLLRDGGRLRAENFDHRAIVGEYVKLFDKVIAESRS